MRKKYPPDKSLGEMKVNAYTMTLEGGRAFQVIKVKKGKLEEYLKSLRLAKNLPRNDLLSDIIDVFY